MDRGIITISTYMAPCAPAQQHTGESLVFSQADEACSGTISNTIHMDIWGLGFWGGFLFFSFCGWSRGELVFALTWCCLLTSAVSQEPDRSKLGDPDILSDPGVRVAPFCSSCCAWNAVAMQLGLCPGHMLAKIKQRHLNRTFMVWC